MSPYIRQPETMKKLRGENGQKVTVEYVDRIKPVRSTHTPGKAKDASAGRQWEPKVVAGEEQDGITTAAQIDPASESPGKAASHEKAATKRRVKRGLAAHILEKPAACAKAPAAEQKPGRGRPAWLPLSKGRSAAACMAVPIEVALRRATTMPISTVHMRHRARHLPRLRDSFWNLLRRA